VGRAPASTHADCREASLPGCGLPCWCCGRLGCGPPLVGRQLLPALRSPPPVGGPLARFMPCGFSALLPGVGPRCWPVRPLRQNVLGGSLDRVRGCLRWGDPAFCWVGTGCATWTRQRLQRPSEALAIERADEPGGLPSWCCSCTRSHPRFPSACCPNSSMASARLSLPRST